MTIQDVNQLLAIMKANYSYAFKAMSPNERYMLLGTWAVTLQDLPADVVMLAVMQLVSQSKWIDILIFDEINDDFTQQRLDGVRTITVSEKCTDTHNDFSKLHLPEYGYDAILRQSYFRCQPVFG